MRYFNLVADHAGLVSLRIGFGLFGAVWVAMGVCIAAILASGSASPRDAASMVGFVIFASPVLAVFGLLLTVVLIIFSIGWVSIFTALSVAIGRYTKVGATSPWRIVIGALSSVVIGVAFAVRNPPDPTASVSGIAAGLAAFAILGAAYGFRTPPLAGSDRAGRRRHRGPRNIP